MSAGDWVEQKCWDWEKGSQEAGLEVECLVEGGVFTALAKGSFLGRVFHSKEADRLIMNFAFELFLCIFEKNKII